MVGMIFSSFMTTMILFGSNPFKTIFLNKLEKFNELTVFYTVLIMFLMLNGAIDANSIDILGWVLIIASNSNIAINCILAFSGQIWHFGNRAYNLLKCSCKKKKLTESEADL